MGIETSFSIGDRQKPFMMTLLKLTITDLPNMVDSSICYYMSSIPLFGGKTMDENSDLKQTGSNTDTHTKEETTSAIPAGSWYISVDTTDGEKISYPKKEIKTRLRANIIAGKHDRNSSATIFPEKPSSMFGTKNNKASWQQSTKTTTLGEFGKKNFHVGSLYHPIWSYAKAGLTWGALIGIILKSFDSAYGVYQDKPILAICIIVGTLLAMIPKYGAFPFFVFVFAASRFPDTGYFGITILVVFLVGAALACLPGMAIGGLIGWIRRKSLPGAPDAAPEPNSVIVKAIVLPFLAGFIVFCLYIYLMITVLLPFSLNLR